VPFHGGFGLLTLQGVPKPVYRAFEMLHHLGEERLPVEGAHATVDAWATRRGNNLVVLLTNHALPRQPITTQRVHLEVQDAPPPRRATLERIDDDHANAKAAWQAMGEPEYLNEGQVRQLEEASQLVGEELPWQYEGRTAHFMIELPPHGVAALTIDQPEA
jgi:xylan 1,4-beta-xylosidase